MDPITLTIIGGVGSLILGGSFSFGISKMHQRWLLKQFNRLENRQSHTERELQTVKTETMSAEMNDPYFNTEQPTPSESGKSHYKKPVKIGYKV